MGSWKRKSRRLKLLIYVALGVYVFVTLAPMYWLGLTSLRSERQVYSREAMLVPRNLTLDNYRFALYERPLLNWLRNSFFVAFSATIIGLCIAALAGYALARLRFRFRDTLSRLLVYMYLVPTSLLFIPMFVIMGNLQLLDTHTALILADLSFIVPFSTWLLFGFFTTIPKELEDAARVDGCGYLGALFRVVLPISKPGIVATFIFAFAEAWNEFLYAAVILTSRALKTAPLGLTDFRIADNYRWGPMSAAAVLTTIPAFILFLVAQKFVVRGLAAGAVKG